MLLHDEAYSNSDNQEVITINKLIEMYTHLGGHILF